MIFCTRASPSPVPLRFDVTNGRNTRSRMSAGMPGPLSLTDTFSARWPRSTSPLMSIRGGFDDLTERLGFGADTLDVRTIRVGQLREIDQLAVALNRREAVAEFVRDARGQLADGCEAVFQAKLLFQILHVREIGKQARGALQLL